MVVVSHERCPVCDGDAFLPDRDLFDDRYGHPGHFKLMICMTCGHGRTFPPLREGDLGELYSGYYPRQTAEPALIQAEAAHTGGDDKARMRWWMGVGNQGQYMVRAGEKYLDIGCGNGNSLLEAKMAGASATGIEADQNVRSIAQVLGLRVEIGSIFDDPFPGEHFDLISLNQVIEHMPEPAAALEKIHTMLAPGGRLFVACPNRKSLMARLFANRWINWHVPFHQNHFDCAGLERMARRCRYKVLQSRTVTPNVWLLMQIRAMCNKPTPGIPSRIWSTGWSSADKASGAVPRSQHLLKRMVKGGGLSAIALMARALDAMGQGESLVMVLEPESAP